MTRLLADRRRARQEASESGFTLMEVVIAITLLVIMMVPFADSYITSLSATTDAHTRQVAVMVADTALDQARAVNPLGGTALVTGRQPAAVTTEWATSVPGTATLLSDTTPVSDSNPADTTAILPTSALTQTVGGQTFKVYYYVGTCYEPAYASGGESSNKCAPNSTPPTGSYQMYRVIVAVTWSAPRGGCGSSGCSYVTSTLISGAADPTFDVNPTIPFITSANTDTFTIGTAGTYDITTTGFPPPTFSDTGYGSGACTPSTLPASITLTTNTGVLSFGPTFASGTEGTYTVCVNAVNADGTGTQDLVVTVVKATPTIALSGPTSDVLGTAITAGSVSATVANGYNPNKKLAFYVVGPQVSAPTTCTGGTSLGSVTLTGNGTVVDTSPITPTVAGNYWWYASYPGDTDNTSGCSNISEMVVLPNSPTITATAPGTGTVGIPIGNPLGATAISSVLTGGYSATGTITFYGIGPQASAPTTCTGGTSMGSATVTPANPTYHPGSVTPVLPGDYWLYATYSGDGNNNATTSSCTPMPEVVVGGKATPTVAVTAALLSGPTSVKFTATVAGVSGVTATGTVNWSVIVSPSGGSATCSSTTPLSSGTATCTLTGVTASNTYTATAAYQGDTNYATASGTSPGQRG